MKKEYKIIIIIAAVITMICAVVTLTIYNNNYNKAKIALDVNIKAEDGKYYSEPFDASYSSLKISSNLDVSIAIQNIENSEDRVVIDTINPSDIKKIKLKKNNTYVIVSDTNYNGLEVTITGAKKNTDRSIQNKVNNEIIYSVTTKKNIENIDNFYSLELTNGKDIRNLPQSYLVDDAIKDGVYVDSTKTANIEVYHDFINKYNNGEDAYIRIMITTVEGDPIIYDVLYYNGKVMAIEDGTRDNYRVAEDRVISYTEYEKIGTVSINSENYLALYNGEIPQNLEDANMPDDIFVVCKIDN